MLLVTILLWGASNTLTKYLVASWPVLWVGATRFLGAGLLLTALMRWTPWFGAFRRPDQQVRRELWWRGGLWMAIYIFVFNFALRYTTASHVVLYLGASPVWALLWEERPKRTWRSLQQYLAALITVAGVVVLFWPVLYLDPSRWFGELLGVVASVLWTVTGRQSRILGQKLTGLEVTAGSLWRAGALMLPFALGEVALRGLVWRPALVGAQLYCMVGGGVMAYALWNASLRAWEVSRVFLFINLSPAATMGFSWLWLGEPVTSDFWLAMALVACGVAL